MEKTWRISKEEYQKKANAIMKKKESVQEWADLSLDPTLSNDERMVRIMMNNDPDIPKNNYICQSYMCSVLDPDEDFLEDVIYINSGLAILGLWDEEIIYWVLTAYSSFIDADRTGTTAYTGNACAYVEAAIEDGRFVNTHPEYHEFLKEKLENKDEIAKKILFFKGKRDTIERAIEYYTNAYDLVKKYKNYVVPVTNQLDWKLINLNKLSPEFIKKYKKIGGIQHVEEKPDDPIVDDLDRKMAKKRKTRMVHYGF